MKMGNDQKGGKSARPKQNKKYISLTRPNQYISNKKFTIKTEVPYKILMSLQAVESVFKLVKEKKNCQQGPALSCFHIID